MRIQTIALALAFLAVSFPALAEAAPGDPPAGSLFVRDALLPAPSLLESAGSVQAPDPAPVTPDRGGVLATYSLAHPAPAEGRIAVEADLRIGGTPLLVVGHVSEDGAGVGPQVRHNLGPVTLFGHTLLGSFETGADAMRDSGLRHGGGVEVPIRDGLVVRVGFDRTSTAMSDPVVASSVGVGWRW